MIFNDVEYRDVGDYVNTSSTGRLYVGENSSYISYLSEYENYIDTKIYNEQSLAKFINLKLCLNESSRILIENETTAKAESGWKKFMDFMRALFRKIGDFIAQLWESKAEKFKRYKDIILEKEPPNEDFEFTTRPGVGIDRFLKSDIKTFDNSLISKYLGNIPDNPGTNIDDITEKCKLVLIPEFTAPNDKIKLSSGDKFTDTLVEYFKGFPGDPIKQNMQQLNMTDIYNFCINHEKIQKALTDDQNRVEKSAAAIKEYIEKAAANDNANANKTGNQANNSGTTSTDTDNTRPDPNANPSRTTGGPSNTDADNNSGPTASKGNGNIPGNVIDLKDKYNKLREEYNKAVDSKNQKDIKDAGGELKLLISKFEDAVKNMPDGDDKNKLKGKVDNLKTSISNDITAGIKVPDLNLESTIYGLYDVFYEDDAQNNNSNNNSGTENTSSTNISAVSHSFQSKNGEDEAAGKAMSSVEQNKAKAAVTIYQGAAKDVLTSKATAIQSIFNDYAKVLDRQIEYYIGQDKDDKTGNRSKQTGTSYQRTNGNNNGDNTTPQQNNSQNQQQQQQSNS